MTHDREDDGLLDRLIGQILEQPLPEGPPEEVRRRVRMLGQPVPRAAPSSQSPGRPSMAAWLRTAAAAASLLVVIDLCWWRYVNAARPVCWFRAVNSDTWLVMYENTYVEVSPPPKDPRQGT